MVSCLLVENDVSNRQLLAAMLRDLGIFCTEESAFEDAAQPSQEEQPTLILANASGTSAAQDFLRRNALIKTHQSHPLVILYSTTPNIDDMNSSIIAGASDFLVWPFDQNLLRFKLQQAGLILNAAA